MRYQEIEQCASEREVTIRTNKPNQKKAKINTEYLDCISDATRYNWKKCDAKIEGKLTKRANKQKSVKRILPIEYFSYKENIETIQAILDYIDENGLDIESVIFSFGINCLKKERIQNREHVKKTLRDYSGIDINKKLVEWKLPEDEFDVLGLIYQSYLNEGKKNVTGSYYTPNRVAIKMTEEFRVTGNEMFLDPCCGSGAFLLSISTENPENLYGMDNDPIAVMIAKINLLIKYRNYEFVPKIYCGDYLKGEHLEKAQEIFNKRYDYIATNPPWGAINKKCCTIPEITSGESFSMFFVKACEQLKEKGIIRFLFPKAILNIRVHKDIRQYILNVSKTICVTFYTDMFSGVTTSYVDIRCEKGMGQQALFYDDGKRKNKIDIESIYKTENLTFNFLSEDDAKIIEKVKDKGKFTLKDSIWALGIVTGDNKSKIFSEYHVGMEKIYTGKEIEPFKLKKAKKYIKYDRNSLQQVAKEEVYRAPEKLVYKFISSKLVFAYDASSSLFLNSANILIPQIPGMSIKSVMAFLNSTLFQYVYMKLYGDVKILKGNLMTMTFPKLLQAEDNMFVQLVDGILQGDESKQDEINKCIFDFYELTEEQIQYVKESVYGKTD